MREKVIVFDLDDTLNKEIDFLRSAYTEIANYVGRPDMLQEMVSWFLLGKNAFYELIETCQLDVSIETLLRIYRNHRPDIHLSEETSEVLRLLSNDYVIGILTDGRNVTQLNKIEALGLYRFVKKENIIISEDFGFSKPSIEGYLFFMEQYPKCSYYYVGDNPSKDFIAPNRLGWVSICLEDDGRNIHSQIFPEDKIYHPRHIISTIRDLRKYI